MSETQATERASAKSTSITKAASGLIPANEDADQAAKVLQAPVLGKTSGAVVTDVDGNEYVDLVCGEGSLLLGHGDDRIVAAVTKAVSKGCSLGGTSEMRVRLAELVAARIPSIDMIQFAPSRFHAVREAARLVRRLTDRRHILIPVGSRCRRALTDDDAVVDVPQDVETMASSLEAIDAPPAAVFVEPIGTNDGLHLPPEGYLRALRDWCDRHDVLLVFDEAVTAFRIATGGASTLYDVHPDLTCFGTSMTGGMGVAAYGGRRELMRGSAADETVHMECAEVGEESSFAAGVALLQATAEDGFHDELEQRSAALAEGLAGLEPKPDALLETARIGSIIGLRVTGPAASANAASAAATFYRACLDHGVLVTPGLSTCLYVSAAHRDDHVTRAVKALDRAVTAIHDGRS